MDNKILYIEALEDENKMLKDLNRMEKTENKMLKSINKMLKADNKKLRDINAILSRMINRRRL